MFVEVSNWKVSASHLHFKAKFLLRRLRDQQQETSDLVSVSSSNMAIIHADFFGRSEFKWTNDILLVKCEQVSFICEMPELLPQEDVSSPIPMLPPHDVEPPGESF